MSKVSNFLKLCQTRKWSEAILLWPEISEEKSINKKWSILDQASMAYFYTGQYLESFRCYQRLFALSDLPFEQLERLFNNLLFTEKKLARPGEIIKIYCEKGSAAIYFEEHAYAMAVYLISQGFFIQMIQCPFNQIPKDQVSLHIIYGIHRYTGTPFNFKKYITYNMEHLNSWEEYYRDNPYNMFHRFLTNLAKADQLWDFSQENAKLYPIVAKRYNYIPLGLSIVYKYSLNPKLPKDIDVLFLGRMSDRRQKILTDLKNLGYRVWDKKTYDRAGKANLYSRAKIILNINQYYPSRCVTSRMVPLLSNEVFIVSETSNPIDDAILEDYIVLAPYDQLVTTCVKYLSQPELIDQFLQDSVIGKHDEMWEKISYCDYVSNEQLKSFLPEQAITPLGSLPLKKT